MSFLKKGILILIPKENLNKSKQDSVTEDDDGNRFEFYNSKKSFYNDCNRFMVSWLIHISIMKNSNW